MISPDEASGLFARISVALLEPSSAVLGLIAVGLIAIHRRGKITLA